MISGNSLSISHDIADSSWEHQLGSDAAFGAAVDRICSGRRMFVTRNGIFGIAHASARAGDLACVLLGADVPYILRKTRHQGSLRKHTDPLYCTVKGSLKGCEKERHLGCCVDAYHRMIGQAYVHGHMKYAGDLRHDIHNGTVDLKEYYLE
jgi:hypothetical protein